MAVSGGTPSIREVLEELRDTFDRLDTAVAARETLLDSGIQFTISRTGTFTTLRRADTTLSREGTSFLSVIASEDKKKAARLFMGCMEGKRVQATLRLVGPPGSQVIVIAGPTGDGAVHGIALEKERRPDTVSDVIHLVALPLAVTDLLGNILAVNEAFAAFFSRDIETAAGTNLLEYIVSDDEEAVRACIKGAIDNEGHHVAARMYIDEREMSVVVDMAPVADSDRMLVHVVNLEDIRPAPARAPPWEMDEMDAFFDAAAAMTGLEDMMSPETLYARAVDLVHAHLDVDDCFIAVGRDGSLRIAAGETDVDALSTDMHFEVRETLAGTEEQYNPDAGGRSELYLPVTADGVTAVLVVVRDGVDAFSRRDRFLLHLLSRRLGDAVRQHRQRVALQKYEDIVKKAVEGIYRATVDGDILEVNPAFVEMFGYDGHERELEQLTASDFYAQPDKRETFLQLIRREGIVRDFETRYVTRDRDTFYGRESAWMASEGGRQVIVGIIQDITGQKKTEEDISFYNSLLRHDIYNKHQVAIGYLGLIDEEHLSDKDTEALAKARGAIDEANKLIETVKKLETVKDTEQYIAIDLDDTLGRVVDHYAGAAEQRDIDIRHPPSGAMVRGNELLEDVFSNLVKNAIQHSYADTIGIYAREADGGWNVYVEDDGVGISEEDKNKIFQQGWKGRKSTGSGLGLYLVKKIIEECGGSIRVESGEDEYPEGTRFVIHLKKGSRGGNADDCDSQIMGVHW